MVGSMDVRTSKGGVGVRCLGEGQPVVLLHGIPGSGRSWAVVAELLAHRNRVVVPDLIGFGASARSVDIDVLHAAGQAVVLEEVLGRLQVERAVLVGHDFGGPVALTLARQRPDLVSAVGLLATNTFGDTPIPFPLSAVTWPVMGGAAARVLFSRPSFLLMVRRGVGRPAPAIDVDAALGDRGQREAIGLIFKNSLTRLAELYGPVQDGLERMNVPAFVGWGERDPFFPVEQGRRTAAAIPGARFNLYRKAGHFLPEERPEEIAADVADLVALAGARP